MLHILLSIHVQNAIEQRLMKNQQAFPDIPNPHLLTDAMHHLVSLTVLEVILAQHDDEGRKHNGTQSSTGFNRDH